MVSNDKIKFDPFACIEVAPLDLTRRWREHSRGSNSNAGEWIKLALSNSIEYLNL